MGNNNGKESGDAAPSPSKRRARPSCPGVPVVIPRQGGDAFQQLAYSNKPDDAVILQWAAPYTDGGTPVNGYAVERKAGENGQWVRAHPLDVRETEVALTGLQPGQDYRFRVKASNAIGWSEPGSESESYLVPYDPSNVVRPSFTVGLRDAIVMEHEKVEFVVEVQGIPPPEVQWIVNGSTDSKVIVTDRDPDSGVSTLIVNDVLAGDEGEVKCIATNEAGQSTSSAILSVEAPPRAVLTKKYEDGLIFEEGDIIRLKVEFTGRPRPEITWYHENKRLAPDGRMEIEIMADCTILKVAQAKRSDRGEYSVKLQSGLGEDSASFLVTVANRPSVPGKPQPTDVLESVVSLQWDPSEDDGGCEISCYIVEYNRLGWDMWLKAATSRTPQIRLGDLIPGSTYLFRIKAENPYGVSEPSAQSDLIRLPARSNETSWVPDMTSSELVDPDDTTISSSNLGPRDSDQQVTRSGDFDYLPLDASELELGRLTNPSILGAPPAFEVMGGVALMSEPPDRPGQVELDPRYAFSASAVLEKMAAPVTVSSLPGFTSNDVLSGIGSSSSRNSSSPSVSPERPSLEDALSLDDDSSEGSSHDVAVQQLEVVEQPIQQRGFLLPRSPARLFVHNAIVQSALSSVASSTAPLTLPDVLEQVAVDDAVADSQPSTLDQIEQDLEDQLQVLDQIELDICEGKAAVQNEVGQSDKEISSSDQTDQMLLEQETVMEQIKPSDQLTLMEQHVEPSHDMMESTVAKEIEPAVDVPTILLQEEEMHHDVPVQSHLAAIDSGLCELMAHRGSDGEGQHTDQYSDAYITAVDSMSSCDYGDSPEPDGLVLDRHPKGECPSPPISSKPITEMDADDAAIGTDERPIFLRCVTDQTVKVGTRARFLAEIVSSSALAVTWFFNGLPVFQPAETARGRFKILQEGNFYCLEISPVALEDEGAWTCRAVLAETFGSQEGVSATAQLRVMVPKSYKRPEFVEDLQAILTEEGTVSLECKVVGIPTPVLHWFKDGKEIKAGDVFAFRAPQSDSTAEETATSLGLYACEAINCIGKAVSTSQVRVKNAVQQPTPSQSRCESAGPPVIIEEPFNQKIRVGEDVRFSVRVMVPPKPVQVKWFNKDVPKEASSKYVVGEDGLGGYSLDISPTDINDDGEWKVAIKTEGVDAESSASAVLTLVVPKNYRPPRFLESLKAILTEEGLVSFECKVVGFPTPQLQWFKDGQELKPGDVYQLSGTNSLGSYSCVARNCMGTAISAAELTVDDIQNQLNEEERLQLMDSHRPPVFAQGLRSSESRVGDPLRLTVQVSSTTDNFLVTWFHNDEPIDLDETQKYRSLKEDAGLCHLDVEPLEFSDEGDWKCIVINDFGHAVTSCSVKLTVPRFFRKPHFLEPLRAVLSDEGTVNLECKVIGVPQPSLKWYKDGVELKPGDIHRIMSGQDGTCCLGTYTCEAHNCMGTSSSSAALLGFEDRPEAEQNAALAHDEALLDAEPRGYVTEHPRIARNPSLSTIQEERSSQISLYETANAEDTLTEERAEISVSLDGREVSVSLYETPDLTEEEAQQIVELFAEELSERISYRNTTELPPLRFTRETATSGSLLMEAVVIDVPMEINGSADFSLERTLSEVSFEEAPTEADIEELSAMEALIIEEADQRNDPYFLDDLTIPDLPYEVNDVCRSITGLQEALLVQETCLSDREQPLHLESHSGGATPIVMSPRRLSVEHEQLEVLDDYQIISADGIQSPVDADYYSPLEYSDSCSVLLTSPKTDSPGQEALCVATPTVQQQPAVVDQPVVMATPLSDLAATVPADGPQSAAKGRIESLIVSNKSSLDIRESADETETSADENSQRRASVVEAPTCASLEREMQTASNELEQAEEAGAIPLIETGQSNSVLVESALSAVHLKSDQTSGADGAQSGAEGDPSALMPSDGRIQVTEQQEDATCVEECWNEASRLAAAVDTVMDEVSAGDRGVELEQCPSTSSASDAGRLLGSGQEDDTKGQSFDTVRDEQEILSSADAAHPSPAIGEAAHQGSHSNVRVTDATTGSKVEQTSAASSPIIAEQCGDVPLPFQEVDDCATKEVGAAAELLGNVTIDTPIAMTESEESCATRQFEVKSDDEPVIREESAAAEEKELQIETETGKAEEEAALVGLMQKEIECLQKDAADDNRIDKDVGGPQVLADDAKEANQFETDVKLQQVASKKEIMQEAGEQKDVEKIKSVEPEEISKLGDEQRQIQEESNQSESGDKDVEAHINDVEIKAPQKEAKEDEQFSEEAEMQEPSPLPAEEKEHVNKEVEMQDEQMKDEDKQTVLNVEDFQETRDTRERLNDAAEKEAQEKELVVKEAEAKERIMKDIEETERMRIEADEKEMLQRQAEEEERLLKETAEKERLLKEAEEKERLLKEAEEKERLIEEAKEAAEQERLLKEADERERDKREAEERELRAKEAEEQERLLRDAEEKECRLKEAEERERLVKEAEESERLRKEAEETERLRLEAEEIERLREEAEENERLQKEIEEKERLVKEAEETERAKKEAEEKERHKKEIEEIERLAKEAEEQECRLKEAEEKERLRIEAEEQSRLRQEAEQEERLLKEAEEKERALKEAEEKERALKEAEEQERALKEAEDKERALKEAEEQERALKEAEDKERALKEAEEKERLLKESEEKERLAKEAEEKEHLKIEAEANERLIQEAEEKERFIQEAKENERLLKEAEEKERLIKEAEEQERLLKEAEENDSHTKEAEERERLTKEAKQTERIKKDSEERELLLQEAVEQASLAVEADEMERLKQEAGRNEGLPKDPAQNSAEEKEVGGQGIPVEETNRKQEPIEGSARVESQQISGRPEATTSSFPSSGALPSMDASLPRRSETSHLMTEKPQLLESSTSSIESSLTEDELIAKQIEEEKLKRRREAAERSVREQEREASGQTEDDVAARRHEERLRLEQCELHQTVDEHIRKQQQQEEVIQRESEEEKIRLQKQKEEERRLKLEEAEKLRREVEVQERQRREEKEAKRLEAERIRREEEAQEWMLKERERLRLEEEIERLESERLRMKEERRLRQAKEEEEERLRVKKEREERLRREQEEEERLRREEEEQLRLMKEERERARKQKEEEEERMLREIEERAQKKKEENERLRKEKEEEERRKKEEERLRREDEERKRAEAAEKLRREAEEKMREKEEKRTKQEEERKKRDEEDKRMKEELRKQKEEEAKQMLEEQEAARIKRAEEQKMAATREEETAERCVKQTEAIQQAAASRKPTANEAGLDQSKQDERSDAPDERSDAPDERSAEVKLRERRRDEDCEREAALVRKQDDSQRKEPEAKTEEEEPKVDDEMMRQKVREEKKLKEIEKEKERSEAEAKAVMEQQERKKAEQEKLEEQRQEKERQAAEAEKRNEEEKQRREAEEKRKQEQEEKERKEAEQKKLKELLEAEEIQLKEQRQKEAEEKRLKDQAEKERKEREEKELKEKQEKQEAEQRKLKELQEAEEKKLKEEAEKERREREDKESKEKERKEAETKKVQEEKERKEAEAKKLQEEKERKEAEAREKKQQEKKLKEAEELKKKERQEAEEKKLKEQKEKERQEAEEKKLKERKEAEEKELKEQEEKKLKKERERERQEAQELQWKEQQEKEERKERKKKDKLEKERKEMEQKQTKEQQELTKKADEDERTKSSLKTGERKEPRVKAEEERPEREAGRHVDDARNRSDDVSPNKERRRRPITNSDEQQQPTLESCCDNSTRTTRPRARPADESQFDAAAVGSATTRRRPAVPTVFEEAACDSMNPSWQQPGIDGSSQTHNRHLQLSTDFDLHPATRLSREDVRHGIRARSAGVASHSMLNRSAYRAESHSTQPEWDSSTQTNEDGRRDPTKKPKFSSVLRDMEVAKGCQIKLTCSLLCNPEPEIEWFRNGLPILKCENRHRYATSWNPIGIASLEVRDLTRSDTGEYMCVARNQHGQASTLADVRVRGDYEPKTSSPSFTSSIRDVYHEASDELVLECAVDGFPTPKITWMKDGIKLHLSSRYKHSLDMDGRCRLVVHSPCVGDSGHYTCVAQNASRKDEISSFVVVPEHVWNSNEKRMKTAPSHAGYSGSAEFYRRQAERDKIASSADGHSFDAGRYDAMAVPDDSAHFVLLPESTLTVGRDRDLVIQCRVRGHPRPKVTWLKGIRDVAESGRSCVEMDGDLYRFVLKKANYGDGGTYIVKASNCHGTQKAYCTVRVKEATNSSEWDFKDAETSLNDLSERRVRRFNKDVPGPVAAPPMATVSGKNVVSLSWPKPNYTGGAPILAYKVEAWLLGEGAIWIEVAMTCITSTDVYNLKPEREYLFRITPRNKYGWGESLVSSTPIQTVSRTGLPHFHRQLHPQIKALEHTDVELLTEVSGQPTPLVEWYRDGSKLDGVKQPRYELRSIGSDCRHALTIHDVQMETDDDSKFTCEAVNPAGRVATFSRVLVVTDQRVAEADALFRQQLDGLSGNDRMAMAPQFTMRPRDRRVQLTFPVRLTCQLIGCPKPDVTWYHNDSAIIIGDDERHSYSVDGNFHTLEIAATKFDDAGIYSVQGRNCSGAVGCQCCLVVDGGIRAYVMPFFTHELEDRTVSEGGTFSLIARVEAYPAVGVLWHRDGIRLRPCRQYDMRLESDGTVALVVSGVLARRHAGVYTCTVTNEMGQVSSNARVTIRQRPLAIPSSSLDAISSDHDNIGETSVAPRFVQKPTEFVEGDALVVVCEVLGDPKPEVIWLRDWLNPPGCQHADRFVSEADAPVYKLTVPCVQLDFSATYSVVARNLHGEAKAAISLQVYVHGGQGRQGSSETVGSSASVGRSTTFSRVLAAPTVVQPLRHLRCCDGDTVTFECRFNGQPETAGSIQIHWLRGGKLLRLCKDFSAELKAEEGVVRLSIRRVYPEDEGEYTCVAYNELGSDSTSACLIVDVADDKENDLMVQLDSRPAGTVSARATPRTTPSRTIRSVSPINSKAATQQQQQQKSRVRKVPPKFYSVPHNKIAETGETVRFQCNVGGNPSPRVTWDRDNIAIKPETIAPAGRVSIEERDDVRVLEIRNVTSEDAGLYRITVENELGRIQANARLDILSRSSGSRSSGFIRSGSAASAGRGAYYSPLSGSSASRLAGRALGMSSASYLRGSSTPRSGGGRYHATSDMDGSSGDCVAAKSKASNHQAVSFVQQLPSRMRVNEGDAVELQVVITGTPPLKVVWVQNDAILADCPEFRHLDYGDGRYALRLSDAFTHDSGVYFCEAYNRHGEAESWCRLIVSDPTDKLFTETSAEASTTLAYSSANTASVRTQNDEEEEDNNQTVNAIDDRVADYRDDEDVFSCSKEDLTYESDNKLNDELDNPFQVAAQIVKGPVSVSTLVGSTVLLEALIIGRPEPTVRWLKGGKELAESERVEMRQADGMASLSLHRITADDSGKYIVMAENTFGMDCHYASLAVEGPPDPGGKPTICEVKADSLTLTWYGSVYDGGSVITGYLVEICETGQSWTVLTSECNSTSYVIHGLAPLRTYQFRVRAKNIHGCSEPSSPSDPLFLQPPSVVEKRDKAVVNIEREEKDHQTMVGQADDDQVDYDRDDDDESHAPQFEHCHVTVQPGEPHFQEKYSVHEELGKGRFGVVYRLVDRASGALRAAKYVRCIKAADREKVYQEVAVMNKLQHPKLLQLAAAYDCPKEIVLVTEYISGGELFERVVADDFTLTERDCILFMRQICEGVGYMHSKSIVHLDLKPENILCQSPNSHRIKLIDFGLARQLDPDQPVRVLFGTPEFIAPEIVSYEPIGCATDMWSLGVVCYVLLSGLSPFMGDNDADTFANITSSDYDFDDDAFAAISCDAKDFISSLLVKRPELRLSAEACLQHQWLAQAKHAMNSIKLPTDRLKKFIIRRKWQKTGTAIRALGRMASLSSASRRNSSSSSTGRRTSRMDSLCEEEQGSVFSSGSSSRFATSSLTAPTNGADPVTRIRSPSLPVVTHPCQSPGSSPGIARSRSPSLPATGPAIELPDRSPPATISVNNSPRRVYYADRSDSGISDCSNHSSTLLSGSHMPTLIQEEEDDEHCGTESALTNGCSSSDRFTGGTFLAQKSAGHSGQHALQGKGVVSSRHSVDSAIDAE